MTLFLAMLLQSAAPVSVLTDMQQRDIDCVATFGLIAFQQSQDAQGADRLRAMAEPGKVYAGLVGSRVMEESGLPREIIAAAIAESARSQANAAIAEGDVMRFLTTRYERCEPLLDAEIAAGADEPLPEPQR
ncbi:hypothetical protein [Novosphingopyxis sp. YJ-S2-01]|uniref:hypothetical protein n=1 Tax=Novosphingopyxis sp. YJ-S2-01 TaxID=2794021 RepID=UPI0018DB37DB|nr:hypothetical protein [Novosphingopyxis sp. YJ-S2-01]MBH9538829.1 hypothetical protein [Novosphingopyxis sp. YJ-S2-01]